MLIKAIICWGMRAPHQWPSFSLAPAILLKPILLPFPCPQLPGLSFAWWEGPRQETNAYHLIIQSSAGFQPCSSLDFYLRLHFSLASLLYNNLQVVKWIVSNLPPKSILPHFNANEWGLVISHNERKQRHPFHKGMFESKHFWKLYENAYVAIWQSLSV